MLVLNAAGHKPFLLSKPTISSTSKNIEQKTLSSFKLPRNFNKTLAAFSSVLYTTAIAKALTYEEALNLSINGSSSSDFDIGQIVNGIANFTSENPLIIGGGAAVLIVPLVVSQFFAKEPKKWGIENAKVAYAKLGEDVSAQLVDIREGKELNVVGRPDLKGLKKKAIAIAYRKDDKNGFLKKLALKFKDPENTTLFILDKFDDNSELVAELATANGFKSAYAIKGGAEGPRGWINSGLPWAQPKKALSLDFGDLSDAIANAFGGDLDGTFPILGLAAATGLGFAAFTEIETLLQLLGSAAIVQFVTKKLLFAEDRKKTVEQVNEFLNTAIAPKEIVSDIKMIGKALLPIRIESKSLPPPAQEKQEASSSTTQDLKTETVSETKPELKEVSVVNSVPSSEVNDVSLSSSSTSLSPFPNYSDFKPPSSPSPPQATGSVKADSVVSETKAEVKVEPPEETLPAVNSVPTSEVVSTKSRPLSPFPYYPDFKPPSSPSPTKA